MTAEEKDLLLKDLCARLPYGVKCQIDIKGFCWHTTKDAILKAIYSDGDVLFHDTKDLGVFHYSDFKPYLRPMSSMTEDEEIEYDKTFIHLDGLGRVETFRTFDWLNQHHFDYRGLINKGLALEAPEGMYNF